MISIAIDHIGASAPFLMPANTRKHAASVRKH